MEISEIRSLINNEMQAVDDFILERLSSDVVLVNQIGHYIVNSGGKRLRPMLLLLAARALGYSGREHIELAAVIEFIHTATLLHDDVVDGSELRRSRQTANAVWGNAASVLVGDFLYSRAFEMMVSVNRMRVMEVLSTATNRIAEGEVLQLMNCHDPDTTEQQYREVILRKTATLFEAGTQLAGVICDVDKAQEQALADYGRHLGIAFQIIDDALDYGSSGEDIGKNIGDDLAEGKPTLPLIRAMAVGSAETKKLIEDAIKEGGRDQVNAIIKAIETTDALAYTVELAKQEAERAKATLKDLAENPYKNALIALADFSVNRMY